MVSFLSSGNDADQDDRTALKEQLSFYYIKRSLEVVHSASFSLFVLSLEDDLFFLMFFLDRLILG
jgi:hypothetical protein